MDIKEISQLYVNDTAEVIPLTGGNLHQSYCIKNSKKIFLQKINTHIFTEPSILVSNYLELEKAFSNTSFLQIPKLLKSHEGEYLVSDNSAIWRAMEYIEGVSYKKGNLQLAFEAGRGLACFHSEVNKKPLSLKDPLPYFHHTPVYLKEYDALKKDLKNYEQESSIIEKYRKSVSKLLDLYQSKKIPQRIIHGDPKLENFIFNKDKAVALIDLDTVKPGLILFDIGDACRSLCNLQGEDGELSQISFDENIFKEFYKGYISVAKNLLNNDEKNQILFSIKLITFELGLRFFTDFLNGNIYFNVKDSTHNLRRAKVQFALLQSIESKEEILNKIIS